jgi:Mor family transcriptional regulator
VYEWLDPMSKKVFYVGKGKNNRAYSMHSTQRCYSKLKKILHEGYTMQDVVNIVHTNLDEREALKLESQLILKYGRLEDGGTLFNYIVDTKNVIKYHKKKQVCNTILQQIKHMYEINKFSFAQIGNIVHINPQTVRRYYRKLIANIDDSVSMIRTGSRIEMQVELQIKIIDDYKNGMSIPKLVKKYSISFFNIKQILKKSNITIRGRRNNIPHTIETNIVQNYLSGKTCRELVIQFGISYPNILRVLDEHNINRRSNSESHRKYHSNPLLFCANSTNL